MDNIIVIAGPTAVGKTKFAIAIAEKFNAEIVSCDSMQLYKYMDIGSAKPTEEEMARVKHHLVDFADPREDFSVARYQQLAKKAIRNILEKGKLPLISGGTGLYLNSILYDMEFSPHSKDTSYREKLEKIAEAKGSRELHRMLAELDADAAEEIHPNNKKRLIRALERLNEGEEHVKPFRGICRENPEYDAILIGLTRNREELYDRINRRVDELVSEGLFKEVEKLMDMGLTSEDISMKGIGYKEIIDYFTGVCDKETAIDNVKKNTRHYAKKQLTWFRRYDKMNWYNISDFRNDEEAAEEISLWLEKKI